MHTPVVIAGSGLAGYTLAREVRKLDPLTPLTILSRDGAEFYSKPMLSNALSAGKSRAQLVMKTAERMAAELQATIRPQVAILAIDPARRHIDLANGERVAYRDLVLALGADPIRLPIDGNGAADVASINDLDDFGRFASWLEGVRRVVILGAGLIGCEFANDMLARAITPTLVDIAPWPLGRLLPEIAAGWFRSRLEHAGVGFRMGRSARAIHTDDRGYRVELDDGTHLPADIVLSAIGLRPRTDLARAAGIAINRGIQVDRLLATTVPRIHAMGDCAEVEGLVLPFVMPIMHQARALAATLTGTPTPLRYPAMPVVVKTPACPTVVCPPPPGTAGDWRLEATPDEESGLDARFLGPDGRLLGFALLGGATSRKQALTTQAPPALA